MGSGRRGKVSLNSVPKCGQDVIGAYSYQLSRRLAEKRLCGIDKGIGELAVLHELADMAIEGGTNRRELGKLNVPPADLNPVIGETRHAEHAARRFLGEPQHAAPATQGRSNASLGVVSTTEWPLLWTRAE